MVAVGTFFNVEQHIFHIISHEMMLGDKHHARVPLNAFNYYK
jgi:hypothetical protein